MKTDKRRLATVFLSCYGYMLICFRCSSMLWKDSQTY
nr:MAG TPA: hypothetical protein [Bacteriophage sp.]